LVSDWIIVGHSKGVFQEAKTSRTQADWIGGEMQTLDDVCLGNIFST
jgi:hypothetical protein